ncbi:hypothetical protein L195_g000470 [Trifolium pratense]|uniref:Mitochondrial protein n=1 Tax=Trifolium pratense TaxID=57577 RepID=A0A2K3NLZ1_TRIPR|nr:hypothetical protein L195_g000470 [Trifolium pratense]
MSRFLRIHSSLHHQQILPHLNTFVPTRSSPQSHGDPKNFRFGITYEHRHVKAPETALTGSSDSALVQIPSPIAVPSNLSIDLPIAARKGKQSTSNPHPIYNFLRYYILPLVHYVFVSAISSIFIPKNVQEALSHLGWRQTMIDKMAAFKSSCQWVFAIKVGPDGQVR